MRRLRLILPASAQITTLIFLVLPYLAQGVLALFAKPDVVFIAVFLQVLAPVFFALIYGYYRASHFNPLTNKRYSLWLANTPWTYGKPLPLGPIRLVWEDVLIVGALILAETVGVWNFRQGDTLGLFAPEQFSSWQAFAYAAGTGVVICLLTYLTTLTVAIKSSRRIIAAILILIPLTFYPHLNPWVGLGVFALIVLLIWFGLRQPLRRFPWDCPQWTRTPHELQLQDVYRKGLIGWPYRQIGPPQVVLLNSNKTLTHIVISFIVGWWFLALPHGTLLYLSTLTDPDTNLIEEFYAWLSGPDLDGAQALRFIWATWIGFALLLTGYRALTYIRDTMPPISLFGRVKTRRWIIPGYDKVFVAPILMLIYAWFGPGLLAAAGLPLIAVPAVSMTGLLLLASLLGPTKEAWRHTGQYRVVPWGPPTDVSKKRQAKVTWASTEINLPGLTR